MKIEKQPFFLFGLLLAVLILQSCGKDDDNTEQEPIVFPHTVYYSHSIDTEFKMWTNGHEVNTETLNIQDYNSGLYGYSTPNLTELESGYIFTDDTLIHPGGGIFGPVERGYFIRNDSIFYVGYGFVSGEDETDYSFFTFGNHLEMKFTKGAFFLKNKQTGENGFYLSKKSYFTRHDVSLINYYQVDDEDLQEGDTLIIYNSTLIFN